MVEDNIYNLDMPQREGKEGYIGSFLSSYLSLVNLLKSPEFSQEPIRVNYIAEAMISLIPDEIEREKIRVTLKQRQDTIKADYMRELNCDKLTKQETSHVMIIASLRTLGYVTDYIDLHIGVSSKNKIGFVRRQKDTK